MDFGDFSSSASDYSALYGNAVPPCAINAPQEGYDARPTLNVVSQPSFEGISEADLEFLKRMNVNDRDVS